MLSSCNGTPTTPTSARNGSMKKRKRDENSPDGGDSINRKRWRKTSPTAAEYAAMSIGSDFPLQKLVSITYRISGIFRLGLIFVEFATSLKLPKIDTAKNKPYYTSSLRVLEIAKIRLSENLAHLPSVVFAKISRRKIFQIYGRFTNVARSLFFFKFHYKILSIFL